ncbi:MAG: hypothetical protein HZA72_01250 [Candidatus Omnitrophica bacterium]|nr:hypothetical protein [Candidatus Omnitrophota bacterium]
MKELIPHKIVIEFEEGAFKNWILLYRVKQDGVLTKGYKSIGIKDAGFSAPHLNGILEKIKIHTKKAEGIEEIAEG